MDIIDEFCCKKNSENVGIEPSASEAQTSRLERLRQDGFTTLRQDKGEAMSTMSLMKEDYWLDLVDAAAQRKTNRRAACCFGLSLSFATNNEPAF